MSESNEGRCCGGRCHVAQPIELSRREFLARVAAGTAALTMAGQMTWAEEGDRAARLLPPAADAAGAYPITPGRIYQGKSLEAVGMPVGGIGTGSIWLDGQGKLGVWQIFNNLSEPRIPDSFFAVRARTAGGQTVTRVLQTEGEGELEPMSSLQYEGSHPIARLTFQDAELPVQVQLEAMNPMIPLDTANSSIPGGLFRLTATNPGKTAVDVSFCATLQNAVGSGGANGIQGVRFPGYGGNRNRVVRRNQQTTVAMERSVDPVPTGSVKIRQTSGREVEGPEMLWIAGMPEFSSELAESMSRIANEGGILLADGVGAEFFRRAGSPASDGQPPGGRGHGLRRFRRQSLRRLGDRRSCLRRRTFARHRTRPAASHRLCRPWAGQHVPRWGRAARHGHLPTSSPSSGGTWAS